MRSEVDSEPEPVGTNLLLLNVAPVSGLRVPAGRKERAVYTFESASLLSLANSFRLAQEGPPPVPIPEVTDLTGYEPLVAFIRRQGLDRLPGDFLEIGCFLGGGTVKLARLARECGKRVWVIDPFNPDFDQTCTLGGGSLAERYRQHLGRRSQEEIFRAVTASFAEVIEILPQDSMQAHLPEGLTFSFAFVDGSRDPLWVASDFELVMRRLTPGGWAAFRDYGGDLPEVTAALETAMHQNVRGIRRIDKIPERLVLLLQRRAEAGKARA